MVLCFNQISHFQLLYAELLGYRIDWKFVRTLAVLVVNDLKRVRGCRWAEGWERCGVSTRGCSAWGWREPSYPEIDSCCLKRAENLVKYLPPAWDRGLLFPDLQAQEFCEGKHRPSHRSLSAVSSSWHDKIPKQGYWGCVIQKCPVVWVEKRGNIRCCFSNKDPVSCLTSQR